jgi:hypothetical protein
MDDASVNEFVKQPSQSNMSWTPTLRLQLFNLMVR